MSRIGKQPISIPNGVTVSQAEGVLQVSGPKGTMTFTLPANVVLNVSDDIIKITASDENSNLHGLARTLTANMIKGVTEGWSKTVELSGTGYRATTTGPELNLALGFSHPIIIKAPTGITFEVKENKISVKGANKILVGEMAAKIRALRPADPYKLKGFKYEGEVIIKKAGKAAKAGGK